MRATRFLWVFFFFSSVGQTKPTLEMYFDVPGFNPWIEGNLKVGKAIYSDGFLHPALLPSYPLSLLLPVAFLKLKTDHSKNTS